MKITSKAEMYELLRAGRLGNTIGMWDLDKFDPSIFPESKPMHVRYASTRVGADNTLFTDLRADEVLPTIYRNVANGWPIHTARIGEDIPDSTRVFQGEFNVSENHYDLTYTFLPEPVRFALSKEQHYAVGLKALLLMQHYVDPASLDDILYLSERYDGAVVEFTTCSIDVGLIPHRNTVIWEVRNY